MSRQRYTLAIALVLATFAFSGPTRAQQRPADQAAPPRPPAPAVPPPPANQNILRPPPSTTVWSGPQPPVPGGGTAGIALRSGKPVPLAPVPNGGNSWFFQLEAFLPSHPTNAVYGDFYA